MSPTRRHRAAGWVMAAALLATGCTGPGPASPSAPPASPPPTAGSPSATPAAPPASPVPPSAGPTAAPSASWTPAEAPGPERWRPPRGASFQIQFTGPLDLSLPVDVQILDWQTTTAAQVAQVRRRGGHAICYFSAGSFEDWRPDREAFPAEVIGEGLESWPGERWLDVTRPDVLIPLMEKRMDVCAAKGFEAVDPDNTDGHRQRTGFTITPQAQADYQRALARAAHARGLSIGLKNNPEQLPELAGVVDFAVNEQCVRYAECGLYGDFLAAGKAVLNIEYDGTPDTVCPGRPPGMSTVIKDLALSADRRSC